MDIEKVCLITFSPTHTSRRVGEAIVQGINGSEVSCVDVTLNGCGALRLEEDTVVVVTVPVYGGHVAPLALERLKALESAGSPTVITVVYGNRAYEKALEELDAFVSARGFKVIAGGTFIGEHSYSTSVYPIAEGRPDSADIASAVKFGEDVAAKLSSCPACGHLYVRGNRPYKTNISL